MNPQDQINNLEKRVKELETKTKGIQPNAFLNQFSVDPQSSSFLKDFMATQMPTGRSHKTSGQTIANTTTTKVQYDTNDFANNIKWDSTNYRFYVPSQGRYLVTGSLYYSAPVSGTNYQLMIYKNGSEYTRNVLNVGATVTIFTAIVTDIVNTSAGDYIEIYTRQDSGGDQPTTDINPSASRFSICLV